MGTVSVVIICVLVWQVCTVHAYQCNPGYAWTGSICAQCVLGWGSTSYCPGDDTARSCGTSCFVGFYISAACTDRANIVCTNCGLCPAGTTQSTTCRLSDPGQCTNCLVGQYTPSYMAKSSSMTYNCYSCEPGQYQAGTGKSFCDTCQAGKFSNSEASSCTTCASGTWSGAAASACTPCLTGGWSSAAASACSYCPAGQTPVSTGATTCVACAAGKYSQGLASQPADCIQCADGSYSQAGASSQSNCTQCLPGNYSQGGKPCQTCPSGTYADGSGKAFCSNCPAGSFIPGGVPVSCVLCPEGITCVLCPYLKTPDH